MRIGSLCSGYGGLDEGVRLVFPEASIAWFCEYDRDPATILAHHWPDVPNHHDVTTTDWAAVEPVDILTAGFPCQDLSYAGKGAGITEGTRSGLWYDVAHAVGVLRPRLVVLENVSAIVARRPGLDVVLGSLAELGFDAEWVCVRASDVGAPHRRERWFCIATPADADGDGHGPGPDAGGVGRLARRDAGPARERERARGLAGDRGAAAAPDTAGERRGEGWTEPAGRLRRPAALVSGPPADTDAQGPQGREPAAGRDLPSWGAYGPAIDRWQRVLGRPAPRPTEPGLNGERLSPRFVEWMQGLPAGHVTDVPGLSRNAQLKALGNGVVPQQAALALRLLLRINDQEAAA